MFARAQPTLGTLRPEGLSNLKWGNMLKYDPRHRRVRRLGKRPGTLLAVAVTLATSTSLSLVPSATGTASASPGRVTNATVNSSLKSLAPIIQAELEGKTPPAVQAELNSAVPLTVGQAVPGYPHGVKPSPANIFHFTSADIAKLKAGHYTTTIAMHVGNAAWPSWSRRSRPLFRASASRS